MVLNICLKLITIDFLEKSESAFHGRQRVIQGLKRHESEYMLTEFSLLLELSF